MFHVPISHFTLKQDSGVSRRVCGVRTLFKNLYKLSFVINISFCNQRKCSNIMEQVYFKSSCKSSYNCVHHSYIKSCAYRETNEENMIMHTIPKFSPLPPKKTCWVHLCIILFYFNLVVLLLCLD